MKNKRHVTDDEVTAGPLCLWDLPMSHDDGDFFFKKLIVLRTMYEENEIRSIF